MRIPQVPDHMKEAPAQALRAMFARVGKLLLAADRLRTRPDEPDEPQDPGHDHEPAGRQAEGRQAAGRPEAGEHDPEPSNPAAGTPSPPSPPGQTGQTAPGPAQPDSRWRSLDQTGNVRLIYAADQASDSPVPASPDSAGLADPAASASAAAAAAAAQAADLAEPVAESSEPAGQADPDDWGRLAAQALPADPAPAADAPDDPAKNDPAPDDESELPLANYGALSMPSLRARLRNLDTGQLRTLVEYEQSHAGRTEVVAMFERRIAKLAAGG
jgi:hypothetical protein